MALTGKQKRRLRSLGHHLQVVVQIGNAGVTKGVIAATTQALKDHELIKIKVEAEREARADALAQLAKETGADVAQSLGKTALLFKQRKNKPKIKLDAPPKPAKDKSKPAGPDDDELQESDEAPESVDDAPEDVDEED